MVSDSSSRIQPQTLSSYQFCATGSALWSEERHERERGEARGGGGERGGGKRGGREGGRADAGEGQGIKFEGRAYPRMSAYLHNARPHCALFVYINVHIECASSRPCN